LLKRSLSGIMLILLLTGMFTLAFNIQPAKASGTIYIRADGSIDPPDAPISTLDNVTYTFTDSINDSIMVERNNIVIDGNGYALQGMEIGMGFYLSGISNVSIKNTEIKAFGIGIKLDYSSNNTISGNNIANNDYGIYFDSGTSHNSIIGNIFVNDGLYVWGSTDGNIVVDNSVNGKPLVYLEDVSDIVVEDAGQVILVDCTRIRVENLSLSNTVIGVYLCRTSYTNVVGNHITNNSDDGIWLYESSHNSITGNDITSNGNEGIYLFSSSSNTIANNILMSNRVHGISVGGANIIQLSSSNTIINNTVTDNVCGFQFWGGGEYYNTVMNNRVHSNDAGIQLGNNAKYNTFIGNTISNNDYGIYLYGSADNKFCHNNLINNSIQVYSGSSTNVWDDGYPSGGNYWSDYTGTDANHDGIGDVPYVIDANNTDHYPSMVPYVISGRYEIAAVYGSTPTVDGAISVSEWSDAASVAFKNTEVFVKQNGMNLYIGFNNPEDQFHDEDIIVVTIDVDHDGSLTPQADDIGLGVYRNGTLLEANVTGGTWGFNEVSGWTAVVNSTLDGWQVEFNITYSKVNVVAGVEKTIGAVFVRYRGLNASSPEMLSWPPGMEPSNPMGNPSTWGTIASAGHNWTSQHDIAIMNVSHKTVVGLGYSLNISTTAANQGDYPETFNVTLYANSTQFGAKPITLETDSSTNIVFTLNTSGLAYGNCTISACAQPVLNETDIVDNNVTCIVSVHVGVPGDISGPTQSVYDGIINMRDISYLILLFTTKPSSPNWNANADINNDATVNMRDISIAILNFNKHE